MRRTAISAVWLRIQRRRRALCGAGLFSAEVSLLQDDAVTGRETRVVFHHHPVGLADRNLHIAVAGVVGNDGGGRVEHIERHRNQAVVGEEQAHGFGGRWVVWDDGAGRPCDLKHGGAEQILADAVKRPDEAWVHRGSEQAPPPAQPAAKAADSANSSLIEFFTGFMAISKS